MSMADHDTEDDAKTPLMPKEDVYRAFVNKIDLWDDMPGRRGGQEGACWD